MCDTEEISFIDDDPCDIIVDDNRDNVTKDESGDNQVDNLENMQQIVKTPTPTQHNTTVGFDMKMTV